MCVFCVPVVTLRRTSLPKSFMSVTSCSISRLLLGEANIKLSGEYLKVSFETVCMVLQFVAYVYYTLTRLLIVYFCTFTYRLSLKCSVTKKYH
jgi:hypothetical protein